MLGSTTASAGVSARNGRTLGQSSNCSMAAMSPGALVNRKPPPAKTNTSSVATNETPSSRDIICHVSLVRNTATVIRSSSGTARDVIEPSRRSWTPRRPSTKRLIDTTP